MDGDLKEYLDANFARIDERFKDVDRRFGAMDVRFNGMEERVNARIEKTETALLTAFHNWARPMELRTNNMATLVLSFEERLALAEHRISELERKKAS